MEINLTTELTENTEIQSLRMLFSDSFLVLILVLEAEPFSGTRTEFISQEFGQAVPKKIHAPEASKNV